MPVADKLGKLSLRSLNGLVDRAIFGNWHNVIVIWAELGTGKTTLSLQMLYRLVQNWEMVLSFVLEPHVCMKCGERWDAGQPYLYEVGCPSCGKEIKTSKVKEAIGSVLKGDCVTPFPYDYNTGFVKKFPTGQIFTINTSKARGEVNQKYPYLNFSFNEIRNTIEQAVKLRIRLPMVDWDDIAVYFHRSNIQYMHPFVKNFFSRYNFVRKYVANMIITVPDPTFVPEQLLLFCTADVMLTERGRGDFDWKKKLRSFWGKGLTWTKHYDGREVAWSKLPEKWETAYEEIRHAHAVEAFEKPEEVLVTSMPKHEEFTEQESLFETD